MKKLIIFYVFSMILSVSSFAQENVFEKFDFLIGKWKGTGAGFGNNKSVIHAEYNLIMGGKYIEIKHDSKFEPTETRPEGEHHVDWGIISYDKDRQKIVLRQFHVEGFVNQYILKEPLSNGSTFIFETEAIENLVGGKARWTIKKTGEDEIETIFDVSFPGRDFVCFGTNRMTKQ